MEIIIGSIPPVPPNIPKLQEKSYGNTIEAQLLHVRPPRRGIAGPSGRERREKHVHDPARARVLTIMVPDASLLPSDIYQEKYTVQIRFVKK